MNKCMFSFRFYVLLMPTKISWWQLSVFPNFLIFVLTNIRSAVFIEALIQRNEQANNCWLRLFAYNLSRDQKLLWLRLSDQLVDLLCSFENKYLLLRKTTIMLHGHKPSRQNPFRAFSKRCNFAIQFIAVQQRIRM